MGFTTSCGRCYHSFECQEKVYCGYCRAYFDTQKENTDLQIKLKKEIQDKHQEIKSRIILNQQLTEKEQLIEKLQKKIAELEIKSENSKNTYTETIETSEIDSRSDSNYSLVEGNS